MKSLRKAAEAFNDVLIARRVAARFAAKKHRFLTEPGVHEFDVSAGPYGATVQIVVGDSDQARRHPTLAGYQASIIVDADVYDRDMESDPDRDTLFDAEDDILAAAGRALGGRARWIEGEWGRGPERGTLSRSFGLS